MSNSAFSSKRGTHDHSSDAEGGDVNLQIENWHVVGDTGEPAFQNSWVNYGGGWETAKFRKLPTGLVVVKGLIKGGTLSAAAWTMPVGYRPANGHSHIVTANAVGAGVIQVYDTGAFNIGSHYSATNSWMSVNIQYMGEQ